VRLNGSTVDVAVSGSPLDIVQLYPPLPQQPPARSSELEALLMTIQRAQVWVGVCVMDFSPSSLYTPHPLWWPQLADALLGAALTRNVSVRLLVSRWQHTSGVMLQYLRSLQLAANNTPLHIKVRQALP
jgi:phospholipase D3/4